MAVIGRILFNCLVSIKIHRQKKKKKISQNSVFRYAKIFQQTEL